MTPVSRSSVIKVGAVPTSAALLILSSIDAPSPVRSALVLMACAGIAAAVASLQPGGTGRRVFHGVLAVEGAFFGLVLAWSTYWIASHGRIPIPPRVVVPYVALVALHHAALAVAGGLAAVSIPPAVRRARTFARPARVDTNA